MVSDAFIASVKFHTGVDMKVHDKVVAVGYGFVKKGSESWPEWLVKGAHSITHMKDSVFGTLVKTDRQDSWVNSIYFKAI